MSLKRNASGAYDPTAYAALKPIVAQETEVESKLHKLIATMKNVANLAGFEVVGRIEIRHKESGREFK